MARKSNIFAGVQWYGRGLRWQLLPGRQVDSSSKLVFFADNSDSEGVSLVTDSTWLGYDVITEDICLEVNPVSTTIPAGMDLMTILQLFIGARMTINDVRWTPEFGPEGKM